MNLNGNSVRKPTARSIDVVRALKKIARKNPDAALAVISTLLLLEADAFDPRLRTHKLKGDLAGVWSCSAAYDMRIAFELVKLEGVDALLLLLCGTRDQIY